MRKKTKKQKEPVSPLGELMYPSWSDVAKKKMKSHWKCRICNKKCKTFDMTCSKKCERLYEEQRAKEKAEEEAQEAIRRSKIATIGDIEDIIKREVGNIDRGCSCC